MDKIRLALVLITIAIVCGPTLGIVLAYNNNLMALIFPPEIQQTVNYLANATRGGDQLNQTGSLEMQYNSTSRTATISFPLQNPLPVDVTLSSISGILECNDHDYQLGNASLKNPVQMKASQPTIVTVLCIWTQQGIDHIQTTHQGEVSTGLRMADATIKTDGLSIEMSDPLNIGKVPLTVFGVQG